MIFEFLTTGHMTQKANTLYLWVLWWHGEELHLCGLQNEIIAAHMLGWEAEVQVHREGEQIYLRNLPREPPDPLCPVIALELDGLPAAFPWARHRLWGDNAAVWADWARS